MLQLETMISCPVAYGGTVLRGGAFQAQRDMQQYGCKELPKVRRPDSKISTTEVRFTLRPADQQEIRGSQSVYDIKIEPG